MVRPALLTGVSVAHGIGPDDFIGDGFYQRVIVARLQTQRTVRIFFPKSGNSGDANSAFGQRAFHPPFENRGFHA